MIALVRGFGESTYGRARVGEFVCALETLRLELALV